VPPGGRAVRRSGPLRGPHRAAVGRNPGAAGQAARPASRAGGGGREHPGRLRRG
jgi:hypothetical protein